MPTLNWIGKDAVVTHHQQIPFHLLKDVADLASGDPGSGNLIVQGDNLLALKWDADPITTASAEIAMALPWNSVLYISGFSRISSG